MIKIFDKFHELIDKKWGKMDIFSHLILQKFVETLSIIKKYIFRKWSFRSSSLLQFIRKMVPYIATKLIQRYKFTALAYFIEFHGLSNFEILFRVFKLNFIIYNFLIFLKMVLLITFGSVAKYAFDKNRKFGNLKLEKFLKILSYQFHDRYQLIEFWTIFLLSLSDTWKVSVQAVWKKLEKRYKKKRLLSLASQKNGGCYWPAWEIPKEALCAQFQFFILILPAALVGLSMVTFLEKTRPPSPFLPFFITKIFMEIYFNDRVIA